MAIEKDLLDQLLAGRDPKDVFNKDGLVDELKKALSERILNAEICRRTAIGPWVTSTFVQPSAYGYPPCTLPGVTRREPDALCAAPANAYGARGAPAR